MRMGLPHTPAERAVHSPVPHLDLRVSPSHQTGGHHRICCIALTQFSTWYADASLSPLTVNTSRAIVLKLRPVGRAPKSSPTGVPVASPRTRMRSPDVQISLMLQLRSGMLAPSCLKTSAS